MVAKKDEEKKTTSAKTKKDNASKKEVKKSTSGSQSKTSSKGGKPKTTAKKKVSKKSQAKSETKKTPVVDKKTSVKKKTPAKTTKKTAAKKTSSTTEKESLVKKNNKRYLIKLLISLVAVVAIALLSWWGYVEYQEYKNGKKIDYLFYAKIKEIDKEEDEQILQFELHNHYKEDTKEVSSEFRLKHEEKMFADYEANQALFIKANEEGDKLQLTKSSLADPAKDEVVFTSNEMQSYDELLVDFDDQKAVLELLNYELDLGQEGGYKITNIFYNIDLETGQSEEFYKTDDWQKWDIEKVDFDSQKLYFYDADSTKALDISTGQIGTVLEGGRLVDFEKDYQTGYYVGEDNSTIYKYDISAGGSTELFKLEEMQEPKRGGNDNLYMEDQSVGLKISDDRTIGIAAQRNIDIYDDEEVDDYVRLYLLDLEDKKVKRILEDYSGWENAWIFGNFENDKVLIIARKDGANSYYWYNIAKDSIEEETPDVEWLIYDWVNKDNIRE